MSNAPTFVLFSGIITVTIDLGYLGYTAYLFFDMKTKISSSTDYVPASVLVSAVMIGISAGLVLLVGFLTLFADRHGDSLEIKTVASEGNANGAQGSETEKSGGDTESQAADKYATSDTSVGPEVNPYGETEDAEAFERCEDHVWLREATLSDDELTLQEYETAQWQIGRIYMLDGGIEVIDEKQRPQPRKRRTNDAPPAPHEGIT